MTSSLVVEGTWVLPGLPAVTPPPGGGIFGSALPIPDGRILYAYVSGGDVRVGWADSPEDFLLASNSVKDIYTVVSFNSGVAPRPCPTLSFVGSTIYMVVSGKWPSFSSTEVGVWVLRDESGNGSGPWTVIATVNSLTSPTQTDHFNGGAYTSELFQTASGRLIIVCPTSWGNFTGGVTTSRMGVYTSDSGPGGPWTRRLNKGWYIVGGIYNYAASRRIQRCQDGLLRITGSGNVDDDVSFSSSDGTTWTLETDIRGPKIPNDAVGEFASDEAGNDYFIWSSTRMRMSSFVPFDGTNESMGGNLADTQRPLIVQDVGTQGRSIPAVMGRGQAMPLVHLADWTVGSVSF